MPVGFDEAALARALAKPTLEALKAVLAKAFSPLEEERLAKALAAAIADVTPSSARFKKLDHFRQTRHAKKALEDELHTSDAVLAETPSAIVVAGGGSAAAIDWRRELATRLEMTMDEQVRSQNAGWIAFLRDQSPAQWAASVARALELRMAADDKLRRLLARLDYGDRQAVQIVVAEALNDMRAALWRIAILLGGIAAGVAELVDKT